MQTIHPHSPRLLLAAGTALLCALLLVLALMHGGALSLGSGSGHASASQLTTRSTLSSATTSPLRPDWWRHPLSLPLKPVHSPWPAAGGPIVRG